MSGLPWWSSEEDSVPSAGGLGLVPSQGTNPTCCISEFVSHN